MSELNNDIQHEGRMIMSIKDVELIYECHRSTAWRKLDRIKEHFKKPETGEVTIYDFSAFTGIPLEIVISYLRR